MEDGRVDSGHEPRGDIGSESRHRFASPSHSPHLMNFYAFVRDLFPVLRWSEAQALRGAGTWTDRDLVAFAREGDLDDPLVLALAACEPADRDVVELVERLVERDTDAEPAHVSLVVDVALALTREVSHALLEIEVIYASLDYPECLRPFVRYEQAEESVPASVEEAERRLVAKAARFVNEEATRLGARDPR